MTLIAVGSIAGSPGVTRLVLGLAAAWPVTGQRRIVVEADADGGRLGAELGVGVEPGLMALALASRTGAMSADDLLERGAAAVADWFVIPAPPSSEQTSSALVHAASTLARVMAAADADAWFVDTGRLSGRSPSMAIAKSASRVLVVAAGAFPSLQLVPHRVEALRSAGCHVDVVVVEPTSWSAAEIAEFVGADVLGVLPHVRSPGDNVSAMRSSQWRSWWSSVDDIASCLAAATGAARSGALRILAEEEVPS